MSRWVSVASVQMLCHTSPVAFGTTLNRPNQLSSTRQKKEKQLCSDFLTIMVIIMKLASQLSGVRIFAEQIVSRYLADCLKYISFIFMNYYNFPLSRGSD